jgi:hypothetical protein
MGNTPDNELNLPLLKGDPAPSLLRTIDEIDAWIEQDYRIFFDRTIYEKEKSRNSVNVPFVL